MYSANLVRHHVHALSKLTVCGLGDTWGWAPTSKNTQDKSGPADLPTPRCRLIVSVISVESVVIIVIIDSKKRKKGEQRERTERREIEEREQKSATEAQYHD